jgi:hypothetical protein
MHQVQAAFNQLIMNYLPSVCFLADGGIFLYTFACKGGVYMDENGLLLDDDLFIVEEEDGDV